MREAKMSFGYQQGQFWHPDKVYAAYTQWDSYHALLRAMRPTGASFSCEYSYTAQRYMAEVTKCHRHPNGAWSIIRHNNSYHHNPMIAVVQALREWEDVTPLVLACCLEIEVLVLEQKLLPTVRELGKTLAMLEAILAEIAA